MILLTDLDNRLIPLKATDYTAVKSLIHRTFDKSEYDNFEASWANRRPEASIGVWAGSHLLAATVTRDTCLEYIAVDASCRGTGLGTQLLHKIIGLIPALHLTPVNDPRVIRWYESQGFRFLCQRGKDRVYIYEPRASRCHNPHRLVCA
jgi:GNAT superfamily N-acetyltransferase